MILMASFIPTLANASDFTGFYTFLYVSLVIPVTALVHFVATVYFLKKGYYRSKSFTIKHLIIALAVPIIGIAIMVFEYFQTLGSGDSYRDDFITGVFIYSFLTLIYIIPIFCYQSAKVDESD